jgi:GH24 family phage-related lysozyme (muramidase)
MNAPARERLLAHLAVDEGCVLHAYPDSLGYLTIGYGRLIDRRRGGGITNAEALMLLENDVDRHWHELVHRFPWVEAIPQHAGGDSAGRLAGGGAGAASVALVPASAEVAQ